MARMYTLMSSDGHLEVHQHPAVLGRRAARGRQIITDDQAIGSRQEAHRLQVAQHDLPAAGVP